MLYSRHNHCEMYLFNAQSRKSTLRKKKKEKKKKHTAACHKLWQPNGSAYLMQPPTVPVVAPVPGPAPTASQISP